VRSASHGTLGQPPREGLGQPLWKPWDNLCGKAWDITKRQGWCPRGFRHSVAAGSRPRHRSVLQRADFFDSGQPAHFTDLPAASSPRTVP